MKKLPARIDRKKEILRRYRAALADVAQVSFFDQDLEWTTPWFIDIVAERRNELMSYLKENGIGSRVMYPPIHKQECYQVAGRHPVSEKIGQQGLWLPSSNQLENAEIDRVCHTIEKFYRE